MRIVEYDDENVAIIIPKGFLFKAGFDFPEEVYSFIVQKGMLAIIRKKNFKDALRKLLQESFEVKEEKPKKGKTEVKEEPPSIDEKAVLKKLAKIPYDKRTPDNVLPLLSNGEQRILQRLIDEGKVRFYKRKGVYSIEDKSFPHRKVEELKDFLVVSSEREAQEVSSRYKDRKGEIIGIKGFDGRYYFFLKNIYSEWSARVIDYLRNNKASSLSSISKATGIPGDACKGILYLLLEVGEIMEKRPGYYTVV